MKAFKLIGAAAAGALLLLTSCLGESDNRYSRSGFAVAGVSEKTYQTVLYTSSGIMYSPSVSSQVVNGACYLVNYEVDFGAPENADISATGYYTATIAIMDEITKGEAVFYNAPDTTELLPNEQPLKNVTGFSGDVGGYLEGNLFLQATIDMLKDQKNRYTLYWDRSKEPTTVEGISTYSLFLRAVKTADGTGAGVTSYADVRAFDIKTVLESVNRAEEAKDSNSFNLKINYLNTINEKDSTNLKWSSFTYGFAVSKGL